VRSIPAGRLYYSISEVSDMIGVKPHVLRYWETQFPSLRPKKNRAGNRMYRPEEVQLLTRIKELLYAQRFTIEGARRLLTDEKKPRSTSKAAGAAAAPLVTAAATAPAPVATSAPVAPSNDAERKRLEKALAAAEAELAKTRTSLATSAESLAKAKEALTASQVSLAESKDSLAVADDRDKTRVAAMAVLRQELLLLARELRGEDEKAAAAPTLASAEPRVSIKTAGPVEAAGTTEPIETGEPEPLLEREAEPLPVGVIAASVGA